MDVPSAASSTSSALAAAASVPSSSWKIPIPNIFTHTHKHQIYLTTSAEMWGRKKHWKSQNDSSPQYGQAEHLLTLPSCDLVSYIPVQTEANWTCLPSSGRMFCLHCIVSHAHLCRLWWRGLKQRQNTGGLIHWNILSTIKSNLIRCTIVKFQRGNATVSYLTWSSN